MGRVSSFNFDHTKMLRGLYVSRKDRRNGVCVTTFDLRMKRPYHDAPLPPPAAHALEHCLATFLRNISDDIIYVGPMGCMTGFYIVVWGDKGTEDIRPLLLSALKWVTMTKKVPGSTKEECGNYHFMDMETARVVASAYMAVLLKP